MSRVRVVALAFAVLLLSGCSSAPRQLSASEVSRLDSLDATGVVRTFFESGDPAVELHLLTPQERALRAQSNYVPDHERAGGVDDLKVRCMSTAREMAGLPYPGEQLDFEVTYRSRRTNVVGEPPGKRLFFVRAGRADDSEPWRVVSFGTGP